MGRSRTYIIIGGYVITAIFLLIGPLMEDLVDNLKIGPLTVTVALVNVMICLVQMSGEAWVLTLFESEEEKSKASTYMNVGYSLGYMIGYNIFTPLNDIEWLNQNFFEDNPRKAPIVTHTMMCIFIAILFAILITFNMLFVAEQILSRKKQKTICQILSILPRHFTNKHMAGFLAYMFFTMFVFYSVDAVLDLKLVKNGYQNFDRATLSNIGTLMYPIVFVLSISTVYYMHAGQLIRMFHLNLGVLCLSGLFRYFMTLDLMYNRNTTRAFWARAYGEMYKTGLDFTSFFLMGFFNTIVDESVGNTGITCLISMMNQTGTLSSTFGF